MLSFKEEEVRQACFLLPPGGAPRGVRGVTRDGASGRLPLVNSTPAFSSALRMATIASMRIIWPPKGGTAMTLNGWHRFGIVVSVVWLVVVFFAALIATPAYENAFYQCLFGPDSVTDAAVCEAQRLSARVKWFVYALAPIPAIWLLGYVVAFLGYVTAWVRRGFKSGEDLRGRW